MPSVSAARAETPVDTHRWPAPATAGTRNCARRGRIARTVTVVSPPDRITNGPGEWPVPRLATSRASRRMHEADVARLRPRWRRTGSIGRHPEALPPRPRRRRARSAAEATIRWCMAVRSAGRRAGAPRRPGEARCAVDAVRQVEPVLGDDRAAPRRGWRRRAPSGPRRRGAAASPGMSERIRLDHRRAPTAAASRPPFIGRDVLADRVHGPDGRARAQQRVVERPSRPSRSSPGGGAGQQRRAAARDQRDHEVLGASRGHELFHDGAVAARPAASGTGWAASRTAMRSQAQP